MMLFVLTGGLSGLVSAEEPEQTTDDVGSDADRDAYVEAAAQFAEQLIKHGRDRYGPKETPLFVSQLDMDRKRIPDPDTAFYGQGERGGAGPTSNNLQYDNGLVRLLDALSRITGDPKFSRAVDEYLSYYFEHLPDPDTGLFPWGDHRGYDVTRDEVIDGYHEFKRMNPPWKRYYEVNPKAVGNMIEALHRHIFDPSKSFGFSRHYPSPQEHTPHSMPSSGGTWIASMAFLYQQTGNEKYLNWVRRMDEYFWSLRNPNTNLLASHPFDPAYSAEKQNEYRDGLRAERTEYMAQLMDYAPNLLIAADRLGSTHGKQLREHALAFARAFVDRMDVQDDGSFYATFHLKTGEPLFDRIQEGWKFTPQQNETYSWSNSVLGLRAPISVAFLYRKTGDPAFRRAFDRLLPLYEINRFAGEDPPRRDLPAGLIAQALTSFVFMYRATGEKTYLEYAEVFAQYAMTHYRVDGWFVSGPALLERYHDPDVDAWRTYSNRGGSDNLALALVRLSLVRDHGPDADFIGDNPMSYW